MDTYSKTWLQFVFPVAIYLGASWTHDFYQSFFTKFCKAAWQHSSSFHIQRSFTHLSWSFLSLTSISIQLQQKVMAVWSKHIPLFLASFGVFLFFLLYTLLLLFGQCLWAIPHLRLFSWVNRLKPFMDSYHAPYKAKHRYWPGLLLVLRFSLLLVHVCLQSSARSQYQPL